MRYLLAFLVVVGLSVLALECGDSSSGQRSLLVVVESSLYEPLEASLEQYADTLALEGFEVYSETWSSGDVWALKDLLFEHVDRHGIEGALLIGDLPARDYEDITDGEYQRFPADFFLQSRDTRGIDSDNNSAADIIRGELHLDIYTSRLIGSPAELEAYFARVDKYRRTGPLVDPSAFVFIDDTWSNMDASDLFHLDQLYDDVEVILDEAESTWQSYLNRLTGEGAEFVYQWIHGAYGKDGGSIRFKHTDEEGNSSEKSFPAQFIANRGFKASFVNMANCYSARFTEPGMSVAQAFTVGTDYGLAVIGSSKTGAQLDPRGFHENLAQGMRWGEAYRDWFNEEGRHSIVWHVGLVLMGDPLLKVRGDAVPKSITAPRE